MKKLRLIPFLLVLCLVPLTGAKDPEPLVTDLHYHWEGHSDLDEMISRNQALGVKLGVTGEGGATWGLNGDKPLLDFLGKLEGKPVYKGLQVYSHDWPNRYSGDVLAKLDFVAADALMFPDESGRTIMLWEPGVTFPDPQTFMDRYVEYHLKILAEPINIWSNPTYLPDSLQPQYDQLWTADRMQKLVRAAVANNVVIEINSKYGIPSLAFLRLAKQAGAKFSFGSNRHDEEPGDLNFCLEMYKALGLGPSDMYVPTGTRVR